jgi:hypothetical protein
MAQDRQLQVKLQQAKLIVNILELQEVGSKECLNSASAEWEKAVGNLPLPMLELVRIRQMDPNGPPDE